MNKRILVTGASRGIGNGVKVLFESRLGYEVLGIDSSSVDFSDETATQLFIDSMPPVDVLVNNAGVNNIKEHGLVTEGDFDKLMAVNMKAPYFLCKRVIDGGRIVNISSIYSVLSREKRSMYSTSKAAINGLTRALAIELAPKGILVNSISPGFTSTDLTSRSLTTEEAKELASKVPLMRFATVEEIAGLAYFLCFENTYITGQNIIIDGGYTIV